MAKPISSKFNREQLLALLERVEQKKLDKTDFAVLADYIYSMQLFSQALKDKNTTLHRAREIFGFEAAQNIHDKSDT